MLAPSTVAVRAAVRRPRNTRRAMNGEYYDSYWAEQGSSERVRCEILTSWR